MADQVLIGGIRFHGHHGLTSAEREIGVRFSVDVELSGDLSLAASTDRIADTVDYRRVHDIVLERGRGKPHRLIETLADGICREMLEAFPVEEVTVTVRKETPLLDGIVDHVGVRMTRRRRA